MNERECPCCGELGEDCNCKAESILDMREERLEARIVALEAELPILRAENRRLREACQKALPLIEAESVGLKESSDWNVAWRLLRAALAAAEEADGG